MIRWPGSSRVSILSVSWGGLGRDRLETRRLDWKRQPMGTP